jgi:hypothetical protein
MVLEVYPEYTYMPLLRRVTGRRNGNRRVRIPQEVDGGVTAAVGQLDGAVVECLSDPP